MDFLPLCEKCVSLPVGQSCLVKHCSFVLHCESQLDDAARWTKRAPLQSFAEETAPELISDPCSSLAERPTAPWLNPIWRIFNRFVTFFLFSWIYIRAAGVSREVSICPFHSRSLILSLSGAVPACSWQMEMCWADFWTVLLKLEELVWHKGKKEDVKKKTLEQSTATVWMSRLLGLVCGAASII